jgi:hypothetical protein
MTSVVISAMMTEVDKVEVVIAHHELRDPARR